MAKIIQLTKGQTTIIDDEDFDRVIKYKWQAHFLKGYADGGKYNAVRTDRKGQKGKYVSLHRFILNAPESALVDHEDGNPLNNQKSNLRLATRSQNGMNRKRTVRNKCGYKGVYFNKYSGKFDVRITVNKKRYFLGAFQSVADAAKAYNDGAIKYHGCFALLNNLNQEGK